VGLVDINVHPLDYYVDIGLPMSESLNDSRAACVWFENGSGDILAWAGLAWCQRNRILPHTRLHSLSSLKRSLLS